MRPAPLAAVVLLALAACERGPAPVPGGAIRDPATVVIDTAGLRDLPVPAAFRYGEARFEASCVECHGEAALGTGRGPPLVHVTYEPNHHADIAFFYAVERGVRAHHWRFGDMPPRPEVSREEVEEIIGYVRWLQREAGVY